MSPEPGASQQPSTVPVSASAQDIDGRRRRQVRRRIRRRATAVLATLSIVALVAGLLYLRSPSHNSTGRALAAARERWVASGIRSHVWTVEQSCFCNAGSHVIVVTESQVTSVDGKDRESATGPGITVDQMFDEIERGNAQDPSDTSATFDPTVGYPRRATIGSHEVDGSVAYAVTSFEASPR